MISPYLEKRVRSMSEVNETLEAEMRRIDERVTEYAQRLVAQYPSPKQLIHRAAVYQREGLSPLAQTNLALAERMAKDPRIEAALQLMAHADANEQGREHVYLFEYLQLILKEPANGDLSERSQAS